jgi:tellurite resistance protein TerC
MLDVSLEAWAATIGLIAALFFLDLFVSRPGHQHEVGFREAVTASVFYLSVALLFGWGSGSSPAGTTRASTSRASSSRRACLSTTSSSSS